ncbi:MAG: DUF2769 domain-containing protein [Thermodesulfobacteriota bacterium]
MSKYDQIDKFGTEDMTAEEEKARFDYVVKNCKCVGCPTYVEGDSPVGYCFPAIGTSKNIQWEKDCICETCPIFKEYELSHTFYCTRCSQLCQALKSDVQGGQGGSG